MTGVNNWSGESNIEAGNQNKAVDVDSIQAKAYKQFVEYKLNQSGVWFINDYQSRSLDNTDFKDDFMSFINSRWSIDSDYYSLWEDFKQTMSLDKIKSLLWSEFAKLRNTRNSLKDYITKIYSIDGKEFDKNIFPHIEWLEISQLQKFLGNAQSIDNFFIEKSLRSYPKRDISHFLHTLDLDARIAKISPKEKRETIMLEISSSLEDLDMKSPLFVNKMSDILSWLFTRWLLSKAEKISIFSAFMPYITLREAKEYKILGDSEIKDYILKVVLDGVDSSHKADIYSKLQNNIDEILIETSIATKGKEEKLDTIAREKWFRDVAEQINQAVLEAQEWEIESFESLMWELSKNEKISWTENLGVWNIMEIEVSRDGQTMSKEYYEIYTIASPGVPKNIISFQNKWWDGVYLSNLDSKLEKKTYWEFSTFTDFANINNISFVKKVDFESRIAKGEIKEDLWSYEYLTGTDKQIRIDRQGQNLEEKLIAWGLMSAWDNLEKIVSGLNDEEKQAYEDEITAYLGVKEFNTLNLRSEIDDIDPDGKKYSLEPGTSFEVSKTWEHYSIESIIEDKTHGKITLMRIWWEREVISFQNFYQTFKTKECKRSANIRNSEDIVDSVNDHEQIWSDFKFKSGSLKNIKNSKDEFDCDFLVAPEQDVFWHEYNVLKIEGFHGDIVDVRLWTITKWENESDPTNYGVSNEVISISIGILVSWIKKSQLEPQNIKKQNNTTADLPKGNENLHNSIWAKYLSSFASIATVVEAGKSYVQFFEEYIKEWRDEQVSRIVSRLPVFTEEQRSASITHLENSEKKRMDEYIEKLKIRDSGEATEMVERWILNRDSLEAQKEAAMFYMIEKYGVLYEKSALIQHKWTWLWYEALGWRIWDKLFMEEKAKAEEYGIQFTEEDLVYILLAKQCKWYLKPKRRGKMYKEYEAIIGKWLEDEIEKWKKDADKKRTPKQREKFAIEEAAGGGWPNSFGAMESLLNKWYDGDISKLNSIPFVLMTSGAAYSFAPGKADKFKNGMMPTQFFTAKKPHVDAYNNAVLELTKDIEQKLGWEYVWMHQKFKDLIVNHIWVDANGKKRKLDEWERINYSFELFNWKWWETLSRGLLFLNTRKTDAEAEFETWITDNQDNGAYKEYKDIFFGGLESTNESRFENKDILDDGFKSSTAWTWWVTAWDTYEFARHFIKPQSGMVWFRDQKFGMMYWREITWQIEATAANTYMDQDKKRLRIWHILRDLMDALSESYGQRQWELGRILENKGWTFYPAFNAWGVQEGDWDKWDENFRDHSFARGDSIINRYIDNILQNTVSSWVDVSWYSDPTQKYRLWDITEVIQNKTAANLNLPQDNDEEAYG